MGLPHNQANALPNTPGKHSGTTAARLDPGDQALYVATDDDGSGYPAGFVFGEYAPGAVDPLGQIRIVGTVVVPGTINTRPSTSSRTDTYVAAGNGVTVVSAAVYRSFGIQVKATGAVTSWDVRLEGSLNGVQFTTIIQHTNADGDGITKWNVNQSANANFRSRCVAIVLGGGTNVVVTILGVV